MEYSLNNINSIEKDHCDVYETSGYLSKEAALKRASARLGKGLASSMTELELLNFIEGS